MAEHDVTWRDFTKSVAAFAAAVGMANLEVPDLLADANRGAGPRCPSASWQCLRRSYLEAAPGLDRAVDPGELQGGTRTRWPQAERPARGGFPRVCKWCTS